MPRLSDIRIGMKLAIMSAVTIGLVAVLIISQLLTAAQIRKSNEATDRRTDLALDAALAKAALRAMRIAAINVRYADNEKALEAQMKDLQAAHADFDAKVDHILSLTVLPARVEQAKQMKVTADSYAKNVTANATARRELIALDAKGEGQLTSADAARISELNDAILKASNANIPAAIALTKVTDEIVAATSQSATVSQAEAAQSIGFASLMTIVLGLLTIAVAVVNAVLGSVGIARPLRAMVKPLETVADGNFAVTVPGADRKDEVGQIAAAVQSMAQRVSSTIAEIMASGREVTNASAEIATSTTDLSQRTEEQAASLEETSAAMEELAATVRKNAENAQLANQDANATREVADRGGQVVAKAVDAMARIEESSRKISDIIGVIDEIARQTNLLALNAAVEAARAGEAGRGFAVVASEVRSLAQRSSQAAKDIKDLITNSNGQVKDGVDLVNRAGDSLNEIVESIKKVSVVVAEIANASAEQATGIDEINRALTQMDEVTQQNSALVEENAATAKTLEQQAKAMDSQVAFFQIAAGHDARPAMAAATRPAPRVATVVARTTPAMRKPTVSQAAPQSRASANVGPARRMQAALATAVKADDWKEF
ncbi:MAG: HAMP domain-containing protein [Pseudolabrys sp.]|nr:HAMP domain-containing protein [Pseudolabrys sp.]